MTSSRISLPQVFLDRAAAYMLQPPRAFRVFSAAVRAAVDAAELRATDPASLARYPFAGGPSRVEPQGPPAYEWARAALGEMVRVVSDINSRGEGHTLYIPRPVFATGQYTETARLVGSGQQISTAAMSISSDRAEVTLRRYVGPASSSGSAGAQPLAIDRFDAQMSFADFAALHLEHLREDRDAFLDAMIRDRFDAASNASVVRPAGISADNAFPVGETALDLETLMRAQETLQNANVPTFADGFYRACLTPRQLRQLSVDPDFMRLAVPYSEINPAVNAGAIRAVGQLLLIPSTNLVIDTTTVPGASIQRGFAFGPNAVGYANAGPCDLRISNDDNYGETLRLIWLAIEGFVALDNRFVVGIRST